MLFSALCIFMELVCSFLYNKEEGIRYRYMKKIVAPILLVALCAITACGPSDPTEVTFTLEEVGEVSIHTENQIAFWADSDTSNNLLSYANATWKYDNPNPITLNYSVSTEANEYIITVTEDSEGGDVYTFSTTELTYDVYNCKVGTSYYWTVTAVYNKTSFTSDPSYFYVINDGCRNLYIDGVDNCRDIGGRTTEDGQYIVKQGLIYRTGRYNESDAEEVTLNITEAGIDTMVNQLGIKTDIDLRKNALFDESNEIGGITSSPLGEDINYFNLPMNYGGQNIFDQRDDTYYELNKASILEFFEILADESYYPLAFHCTQGKDRTGALAYALEAMLGMSENDILHDYLFTNFAQLNSSSCKVSDVSSLAKIGGYISQMEGDTLKEQAYNYLVEYGVPAETLDAIRNIMLEAVEA